MKNIIIRASMLTALILTYSCTDLEQKWYSSVVPDTFYSTREEVYSAMGEPYNHVINLMSSSHWIAQEATADNFVVLIRNGRHFNDGWDVMHRHTWDSEFPWVTNTWNDIMGGVARCLSVVSDLEKVDYEKLGFTEEDRSAHISEMRAIMAFFYLRGFDLYGPVPIYESVKDELKPRATRQEMFDYIEGLLRDAIRDLPAKTEGEVLYRDIQKGAAATMLAQLYFNANVFIGKKMFTECARVCEEIIAGDYGHYTLDPDWQGPHTFTNNQSPEMIWVCPSELNKQQYNWFDAFYYNASIQQALGKADGGMNAVCLTPSRDKYGRLYTDNDFRLGRPFEKFHDDDLRKKPYRYLSEGTYEGMFLYGPQYVYGTNQPVMGFDEHDGKPYVLVDQVARFTTVEDPAFPNITSIDDLTSTVMDGEDNSGVRLVKVPIPNGQTNPLKWESDMPVMRLTEVYYMLAECKFRAGDKPGAAALINRVRDRNFAGSVQPSSARVPDDFDEYRLLDEWSIEFLGEGRRRTDLVRWGVFASEKWWDHDPVGDNSFLNLFPVTNTVMAANPLIEPNPGYGQ